MIVVVFACQAVPGSDEVLHFTGSLEECQAAASKIRRELQQQGKSLPPTAVYQCTLRMPIGPALLQCLNEQADFLKACLVHRESIAFVGEDVE